MGWTSIYQLFWGSLGTRVLTHPHLKNIYRILSPNPIPPAGGAKALGLAIHPCHPEHPPRLALVGAHQNHDFVADQGRFQGRRFLGEMSKKWPSTNHFCCGNVSWNIGFQRDFMGYIINKLTCGFSKTGYSWYIKWQCLCANIVIHHHCGGSLIVRPTHLIWSNVWNWLKINLRLPSLYTAYIEMNNNKLYSMIHYITYI